MLCRKALTPRPELRGKSEGGRGKHLWKEDLGGDVSIAGPPSTNFLGASSNERTIGLQPVNEGLTPSASTTSGSFNTVGRLALTQLIKVRILDRVPVYNPLVLHTEGVQF